MEGTALVVADPMQNAVAATVQNAVMASIHGDQSGFPASSSFIDETQTTLWRAQGMFVPPKQANSSDTVPVPIKPPTKRKRKPEFVVHNDGYNWIKYGQKVFTVLPL